MISPIFAISFGVFVILGLVWKGLDIMRENAKELERIRHLLVDIKLGNRE